MRFARSRAPKTCPPNGSRLRSTHRRPWFWARFRMSVSRDSKAARARAPTDVSPASPLTADIAPVRACAWASRSIDPGLLGLGIPLLFVLWPLAWYLAIRKAPDQLTPRGPRGGGAVARRARVRRGHRKPRPPPARRGRVWDRYLAYGVAMDLSEEAVDGLLLHFRTDMKVGDVVHVGPQPHGPERDGRHPRRADGAGSRRPAPSARRRVHRVGAVRARRRRLLRAGGRHPAGSGRRRAGFTAGFPNGRMRLVRRADALRDAAPPEIASAVWAIHHELSPLLADPFDGDIDASHRSRDEVRTRPCSRSPTMKQHAEEVARVPRRRVRHLQIDMQRSTVHDARRARRARRSRGLWRCAVRSARRPSLR